MGFLRHVFREESGPAISDTIAGTSDVLASISGVSTLTLETLRDIARFTPVPYLSDISSVALMILEAAQTFRGNTETSKKLCSEICDLVCTIHATCRSLTKNDKPLPDDLEENLRQLLRSIEKLQTSIDERLRRPGYLRFLTYKTDSEAIQEYRNDIKYCLDRFEVQSNIAIRIQVAAIVEQLRQADDGENGRS
ncbi:hypothetical protein AAF712_006659 [Marasmius tenuissimus]|uniref:Fungal N-terminal domain-containing protein n=1 Tax=Marasmius tenuissimus TaxID=585030 RepID=A0ABR2ZYL6_9AGAR